MIVTHNMQQAARVSDRTAFFTTEVNETSDTRTGVLVEYDVTEKIFSNPPTSGRRTMSPAGSAEPRHPLRLQYLRAELEQLRLQVEVMGVLVDQNLERMREVLADRRRRPSAERALAADDDIDAMNVSLTERCYEVLARENPVASDLRLVVSVIRATASSSGSATCALRVVKLAPDHDAADRATTRASTSCR